MSRVVLLAIVAVLVTSIPARAQIEISRGGTIRKMAVPPGGPGSSYAKAVVIHASDATSGINSEYQYLSAHFPGSKPVNHGREYYTKKTYDVITFTMPGGEKHVLYFDYRIHRE